MCTMSGTYIIFTSLQQALYSLIFIVVNFASAIKPLTDEVIANCLIALACEAPHQD